VPPSKPVTDECIKGAAVIVSAWAAWLIAYNIFVATHIVGIGDSLAFNDVGTIGILAIVVIALFTRRRRARRVRGKEKENKHNPPGENSGSRVGANSEDLPQPTFENTMATLRRQVETGEATPENIGELLAFAGTLRAPRRDGAGSRIPGEQGYFRNLARIFDAPRGKHSGDRIPPPRHGENESRQPPRS